MTHTITPYYRSESCKALAEKVARNEAQQTLDISINIDDLLRKSKAGIGEQVVNAIHANSSFVLYHDQRNYTLVVPDQRLIICVVNDTEKTRTASPTEKAFANNLKLAVVAYDKFMELPRAISQPQEVGQITYETSEPQAIDELK